jgi:spore coat protein U-like protein
MPANRVTHGRRARRAVLAATLFTAVSALSSGDPIASAQPQPDLGCLIWRGPTLAFGEYLVSNASPTDTTGSLQLICDANSVVRLHISQGNSGTYNPRRMQSGGSTLQYNVYVDAARTRIWGDGSSGTDYVTFTRQVFPTFTLYGRIPAKQPNLRVGAYSDTLKLTVLF